MLFCCWSHALREMTAPRCVIALVAICPLVACLISMKFDGWTLKVSNLVWRVRL